MTVSSLGWDDFFASHFQPFASAGLVPARVALEHKHSYQLLSDHGELSAGCTGRLLHETPSRASLPAVGDWVAVRLRPAEATAGTGPLRQADIHAVLPRRTKFSRRAAGDRETEQVVAANVDTVFLVTALDDNYNVRRIERYLSAAWESGAQPVIVLSKSDLHADPAAARAEVETIAVGAPVLILSALRIDQFDDPAGPPNWSPGQILAPWLGRGCTVAFIGSSGVGKSTLINRLLGQDHQRTRALSEAVGKGRHTTTHRELIVAPSGALVVDTPGMRELQFWEVGDDALEATFADVGTLAARCRFSDCQHRTEPGCAIVSALEEGTLAPDRWQSFQKLQREQAYAARKADARLDRESKAVWKKRHRAQRAHHRMKEPG